MEWPLVTGKLRHLPQFFVCLFVCFVLDTFLIDLMCVDATHGEYVYAMFSQLSMFLSRITRHWFHQMCQNIVLEESCRNLSGFRKVLIGNTIVTCLESIYGANKMYIGVYFIFFMLPGT